MPVLPIYSKDELTTLCRQMTKAAKGAATLAASIEARLMDAVETGVVLPTAIEDLGIAGYAGVEKLLEEVASLVATMTTLHMYDNGYPTIAQTGTPLFDTCHIHAMTTTNYLYLGATNAAAGDNNPFPSAGQAPWASSGGPFAVGDRVLIEKVEFSTPGWFDSSSKIDLLVGQEFVISSMTDNLDQGPNVYHINRMAFASAISGFTTASTKAVASFIKLRRTGYTPV